MRPVIFPFDLYDDGNLLQMGDRSLRIIKLKLFDMFCRVDVRSLYSLLKSERSNC